MSCFQSPNFTQVIQTTSTHNKLVIVMALGLQQLIQPENKSFAARSVGPARLEDCFLSPFFHRRKETAHLVPTKMFL